MKRKQIVFNSVARDGLKNGAKQLRDAVAVTLGPKGRNVVISKGSGISPITTKDGVTVAKEVELSDVLENTGAQMVKEVAIKTNDETGDGTTTATVLAYSILEQGLTLTSNGANPVEVKKGIDMAVNDVITKLRKSTKQINTDTEIESIATISANNDSSIGKLIADAIKIVGKEGVVTVEGAKGYETELIPVEGMQFDRGFLSSYFITNPNKQTCELENTYVLVTDKRISQIKDIVPILEQVITAQGSLLIIAEDIDGEALATLVVNRVRQGLKVCAVKAPSFGDSRKAMLEDIAVLTGATVVNRENDLELENLTLTNLGRCAKITATKDSCLLIDGKGNTADIINRVESIKAEIELSKSDFDTERHQARLAKLTGRVCVIKVGAGSEIEQSEKIYRIDDALNATKAAISEGIVAGGGVALIKSIIYTIPKNLSEDEHVGYNIINNALQAPFIQMCINAGKSLDEIELLLNDIITASKNIPAGYNLRTNEFGNMIKFGIIDPVKVTITALKNAASVASMIMLTDAVILELPEDTTNTKQQEY